MKMAPPLLFLVLLSMFKCALSESTIGTFDISSALQLAHDIVHSKPESPIPKNQLRSFPNSIHSSSSSSIALELESRETIHRSNHTDYKSLLHSRLQRDSARVISITSTIQRLLIDGGSKSDLAHYDPSSLPLTPGLQYSSSEFFARIGVGTPPKPYFMVVDTGSDLNWIQCQPCTKCYSQLDPIFDPTTSSSYSRLSCDSEQCKSLIGTSTCPAGGDGNCRYNVSYGDGSYTIGDVVSETVSFGGSRVVNNFTLGCGHDNGGWFRGSAGLIGMGRSSWSLPSQLNMTSFSYCFVNENNYSASSTLDFNSGPIHAPIVATLLTNTKVDTYYYIKLTRISVNNRLLPIPKSVFQINKSGRGGVIVDSGTSITRLQSSKAYNVLRDAFRNAVRGFKSIPGSGGIDTCYLLEEQKPEVPIPTVQFHFGKGQIWNLLPDNYLLLIDDEVKTFCLAFRPETSLISIIGNYQQQTTRISFDPVNKQIGFSPKSC